MGALIVIEIDKYNTWMVNEYNEQYSLCDCWKNRNGEYVPSFCEIKNGMKVPKGLGGRFDDIKELRAMLVLLVKKIDAYDVNDPATSKPSNSGPTDDTIPF